MAAVQDEEKKREDREADAALARAAASGDRIWQRKLLERLLPTVERTVRCLTRGGADADDLIQLSLIQIIRSTGSFRGDSSLEFWADRVVLLTSAKHFEKGNRRRRLWESTAQAPEPTIAPVDEQAALSEVGLGMRRALDKLPDKLRTAVMLYCILGYSAGEVAALTDTGLNTVRGRVRLGLERLKTYFVKDPVLKEWVEQGMQ